MEVNIPDGHYTEVIEPGWVDGLPDQQAAVRDSLRSPIDSPPLRNLAKQGSRVGIIFSDITRATPYHILLPAILEELSHIPAGNITLFCATGTHRPATPRELNTILGEKYAGSYRIVQNNAKDDSLFMHAGKTSSGNEIWINRELAECDLKILTGFIEPHFFMGFSGGGKAVMPGMARLSSIRFNHSIAMLENETARWGITEGNPLWEDVREAAGLLSGLFLLNITLNKQKEITGVFCGVPDPAHKKGCDFAKETAMVPLAEPFDLVITSNSGYPLDLNVYQSVKGMSAAAQIVRKGGEILIAAECWDGIPEGSDYERILSSASSIEELYEYIKQEEQNLQDTWQVFFQAMIQQKANVSLYSDKLDDDTVQRTLLSPVADPDLLIAEIVKNKGPDARICVLPEGPHTIPYISN